MKKPDHYQEIYVKKSQIEREVKDFKRLCTVAQDPKLRESERTYYQNGNRNLDYPNLCLYIRFKWC